MTKYRPWEKPPLLYGGSTIRAINDGCWPPSLGAYSTRSGLAERASGIWSRKPPRLKTPKAGGNWKPVGSRHATSVSRLQTPDGAAGNRSWIPENSSHSTAGNTHGSCWQLHFEFHSLALWSDFSGAEGSLSWILE